MDCLREWAAMGWGKDRLTPLTVEQWLIIGQTVASASPANQWTTIKALAKYYAWAYGGPERDWVKQITAVSHAAVQETVTEQDTEDYLARQEACAVIGREENMEKRSSHNRSSQTLNHKPRSSSVKGQQEMFPEERRPL